MRLRDDEVYEIGKNAMKPVLVLVQIGVNVIESI